MPEPGQLLYLMGASGAGKDSLVRYAQQHLGKLKSIRFAKRYITRPLNLFNDGNHYAIGSEKFNQLQKIGYFAMHWCRHGFQYGISKEIDIWLAEGNKVIINGSRKYFHTARKDYPELHAVMVRADHEILRQRLLTRQRDSPEKIEQRMQSAEDRVDFEDHSRLFTVINNNASLKIAGEKFLKIIHN
ncbi:MAG: phosphonate metabolism protein/1,5-bisphosphokinase (PRPP-forming) PhnN [Deltaproteobacteria bacterium]|nr:phosphonate metabolism protein/1,5-bisphosphokinase (PRPP-forming) PhnN [Deltaproteobacteria bacterium]